MTLIYDHREDPSGVPALLEQMKVPIQAVQLEVGDYLIQGPTAKVIVERKTAKDFVASFQGSERLNNQLFEISTNYEYCVLIIEGWLMGEIMETKGLTRKQINANRVSAILKRSPEGNQGTISMLQTEDTEETAEVLQLIHDRILNPEKLIRLPRLQTIKMSASDRAVAVLSQIEGVGIIRAKKILSHPNLDTICKVFSSDVNTLRQVKDIGPVTARSIFDTAHKKYEGESEQ